MPVSGDAVRVNLHEDRLRHYGLGTTRLAYTLDLLTRETPSFKTLKYCPVFPGRDCVR